MKKYIIIYKDILVRIKPETLIWISMPEHLHAYSLWEIIEESDDKWKDYLIIERTSWLQIRRHFDNKFKFLQEEGN